MCWGGSRSQNIIPVCYSQELMPNPNTTTASLAAPWATDHVCIHLCAPLQWPTYCDATIAAPTQINTLLVRNLPWCCCGCCRCGVILRGESDLPMASAKQIHWETSTKHSHWEPSVREWKESEKVRESARDWVNSTLPVECLSKSTTGEGWQE